MVQFDGKEISDVRYGNKQLVEIRKGLVTVWEFLTGLIFTSDVYACYTSDGYIEKCEDQ